MTVIRRVTVAFKGRICVRNISLWFRVMQIILKGPIFLILDKFWCKIDSMPKQPAKQRIILVDDHEVVRLGLKSLLERHPQFDVIAEASSAREAIEKTETLKPDVVVMDISMPVMSGIEATKHICRICENTKVAILSMHHTTEYIQRALEAGAVGYLLKDSAGSELVTAIRELNDGKHYLSKKVAGSITEDMWDRSKNDRDGLTN